MRRINIHCKQRRNREGERRQKHTHIFAGTAAYKYTTESYLCAISLPPFLSLTHLSCFSFISLRLQCARMINERKFHFIFSACFFHLCPSDNDTPLPPPIYSLLFMPLFRPAFLFGLPCCRFTHFSSNCWSIFFASLSSFVSCSRYFSAFCSSTKGKQQQQHQLQRRRRQIMRARSLLWLPFSGHCY